LDLREKKHHEDGKKHNEQLHNIKMDLKGAVADVRVRSGFSGFSGVLLGTR
jgi:hypothetical protein